MMLETWKKSANKSKDFGTLLTDLFKAFDCLSHDLLISKLHEYGLDLASLNILLDYLTNRKRRANVNLLFGSWKKTLSGVPQGSVWVLFYSTFSCETFSV